MTLGSLSTNLNYGELRSLSLKDDINAVVSYTNLALIALYEKFKLRTSEQIIPLQDNIVDYTLNYDCMTIEAIYDENGDEFVLNDETNRFSIFQTAYDTIQVANPMTGSTIGIVYLASPVEVVYAGEISLEERIPIPPQLIEPLMHYIGFKATSDGIDDYKNPYYVRYEASCNRIVNSGSIRIDTVPAHVSLKESISDTAKTYQEIDLNT